MKAHIPKNKIKNKYLPENSKDTIRHEIGRGQNLKERETEKIWQSYKKSITKLELYEEDLWHSRIRKAEENGDNVWRMIKSQKKCIWITAFSQSE